MSNYSVSAAGGFQILNLDFEAADISPGLQLRMPCDIASTAPLSLSDYHRTGKHAFLHNEASSGNNP